MTNKDYTTIGHVHIDPTAKIQKGAHLNAQAGAIYINAGVVIGKDVEIIAEHGDTCIIGEKTLVERGAKIRAANIGAYATIKEEATLESGVYTGDFSIVEARAYLPKGAKLPSRAVAEGNPFSVVRGLTKEELDATRAR